MTFIHKLYLISNFYVYNGIIFICSSDSFIIIISLFFSPFQPKLCLARSSAASFCREVNRSRIALMVASNYWCIIIIIYFFFGKEFFFFGHDIQFVRFRKKNERGYGWLKSSVSGRVFAKWLIFVFGKIFFVFCLSFFFFDDIWKDLICKMDFFLFAYAQKVDQNRQRKYS